MNRIRFSNVQTLVSYKELLLGVMAACFAAPLIRMAQAPALTVATYRLGISSIVFLPITLATLRKKQILTASDWALMILAATFMASHFGFWIASLDYVSIGSSTFIVTCNPILVATFSKLFAGEHITFKLGIGIILGLCGVIAISIFDHGIGEKFVIGDALAFLGAVAIAGYYLIGRNLRMRIPTLSYVSLIYSIAAIELLSATFMTEGSLSGYPDETYYFLILIAVIPQLIGASLITWALGYFPIVKVSTAVMLEPIGATFLGWLFLSEAPETGVLIGGPFILIGVVLVLWSNPSKLLS